MYDVFISRHCYRQYFWADEKGKKIKTTAPQYVDYVMTYIQKTLNEESVFPSKPGETGRRAGPRDVRRASLWTLGGEGRYSVTLES